MRARCPDTQQTQIASLARPQPQKVVIAMERQMLFLARLKQSVLIYPWRIRQAQIAPPRSPETQQTHPPYTPLIAPFFDRV